MSKKSNIKLKIAFLRLGLTQRETAEILGFHESYISLLLQGKRKNKLFEDWLKENSCLDDLKGIAI